MPAKPSRLKADLILVCVAAIWGSAFVVQMIAGKAGLAFHYNGACFTVAAIALLPLVWRKHVPKDQWGWMLAAGLLLFGGSALQQLGLFYTKVANASFLTSLYVIFTPFLLWIGFREKPGLVHGVAASLAVIGAFFLSTGGKIALQTGDVLEILGAIFWGLHLVLVGKYATRFDTLSFAAGQFLICGLLNFAAGFLHEDLSLLLMPTVIAAVAYRAFLSIGVGYTLQLWAQKFTAPSDAALIFALESVFAALIAASVLGERLAFLQIVGCVLILLAASLSQVKGTSGAA